MKRLNVRILYLGLLAIFIVQMTACQQEELDTTVVPEFEEQIDDNVMPEGRFVANLKLRDSDNPEKGALISVSSNNEEIFSKLVAANFQVEIIDLENIATERAQNTEDVDAAEETQDPSLLNTDEYFFSMKILEEIAEEGEAVKFTFGDELLAVLKKYKAQTHIQVSSEESDRYSVWRNAFDAYGDGGSVRTKLNVRYRYTWSSSFFGSDTNSGFLNYYYFRTCSWPSNSSNRCIYSYFTVTQDVLQNYYRFNVNYCALC